MVLFVNGNVNEFLVDMERSMNSVFITCCRVWAKIVHPVENESLKTIETVRFFFELLRNSFLLGHFSIIENFHETLECA